MYFPTHLGTKETNKEVDKSVKSAEIHITFHFPNLTTTLKLSSSKFD